MTDATPPSGDGRSADSPLRYRLEYADLQAYQRHVAYRPRKLGRKGSAVAIAIFVALVFLLWIFREELWAFDLLGFLTGTIVPVIILLVLLTIWGTRVQRRQVAAVGPLDMTLWLADDGLHYSDGNSDTLTRWSAVTDVVSAKHHLFVGFGPLQALTIPKHVFATEDGAESFADHVKSYRPDLDVESDVPMRRNRRIGWFVCGGLVALIAILLLSSWFGPWRSYMAVDGPWGTVPYMVTETGGADADETLPMIILLHPLGGFPAIGALQARRYDFPVRVVAPGGAKLNLLGRSWFSFPDDWDEFTGGIQEASDRLAAFTREITKHYPTAGKPIVTGFSQGGSMAYALAAFHPQLYSLSVPVAGALAGEIPERPQAPILPIRALHGEADKVMPFEWGEGSVEHLREHGYDVTMYSEAETGHAITDTLRDKWRGYLRDQANALRDAGG